MTRPVRLDHIVARLHGLDGLQLDMPGPTASGRNLAGDHPLFPLSPAAREAVREALDRGETHYADVPGIAPLRQAVAEALRGLGVQADPQDGVIITAGEQEGRFLIIQALAQAGYRIALPSVVHPGARKAAALGQIGAQRFGIDPVTMAPDLDAIRRLFASGPTALYLESPNRLTGKIIDRPLVEAIAGEVRKAEAVVVWDAALSGWIAEGTPYAMLGALEGMGEKVITLGTLWSGYGLDDWLAAFLAGPPTFFGPARSLKQIIAICTTTPAQWGVLGALKTNAGVRAEERRVLAAQRAAAAREWPEAVMPGETVSVLAVRVAPGKPDLTRLPAVPASGAPFGATELLRFTITPTGEAAASIRALAASHRQGGTL